MIGAVEGWRDNVVRYSFFQCIGVLSQSHANHLGESRHEPTVLVFVGPLQFLDKIDGLME
jgi:hypothetical protein